MLAILAMSLLTACGSTMRPREGAPQLVGASTGFGADCNGFSAISGPILSGKVTAFYQGGMLQEDRVRVRLTSIAAEFSQSSGLSLQFFRWTVDAAGTNRIEPVNFNVDVNTFAGPMTISSNRNSLTLADVNTLAQQSGIMMNSVQDFFNNVTLTVIGTDYYWSALKVVLYNGTTAVAQADALLPVFAANPNTYAATHHSTLSQLHPFWSQRTQAASDADWVLRSKNYCF